MKKINETNYLIALIISIAFILAFIAAIVAVFREPLMGYLGMALISYPFQFPNLPRVMPCPACLDKDGKPISTVHRRTKSGEWVCWCGTVAEQKSDNTNESEQS